MGDARARAISFDFGALPVGSEGVRFRVWAPRCHRIDVQLFGPGEPRSVSLDPEPDGIFNATVASVGDGARYRYRLDDRLDRPDPVSRYQPEGVHGPSAVVDPTAFAWTDAGWEGVLLRDLRLYELHVGTFTA